MAQLVARQTEDLKVASSILAESINCFMVNLLTLRCIRYHRGFISQSK